MKIIQSCFLLAAVALVGCGGSGGGTSVTPLSISWGAPPSIYYGTPLSGTQLNATANVAGTFTYSPAAGTVLTAGTHTLSATFTPADTKDYTSTSVSVSLTVDQVAPSITWATPASIVAGTALSSTQLDATSNAAGTFVYSPAAGTEMGVAGSQTLSVTFTPTDTVDYSTATASVTLTITGTPAVDFAATSQTIRGFGGAYPWAPGTMPNSTISALFGTTGVDLGLTILRLHIAPATWTTVSQSADTSAWTTELSNGKAAQALGATIFASPWSPPASMKTNGSTNEGSLSTTSYDDYANYLKAYVNYAASQGVNLYAISMQNEPDWNPCDPNGTDEGPNGPDCYESCLWTGAQMDTWVAQSASTLTTGANPVKLIMPESFYFADSMSDPTMNDSAAVGEVSIVAGHLYGSAPHYSTNAKSKGKDVWMTEHYLSPATWTTPEIADAIALGEELHTSLTVAQYNAYVWWGSSATNPYSAPLIDANNNPNYYGYAMAQFSRFVRPGYLRVNATQNPSPGVYMSAYTGNGHAVIVLINSNTTDLSQPILMLNQTITSLTPYQTSAAGGLIQLPAISVAGNSFTAALPAQSITTFVQ